MLSKRTKPVQHWSAQKSLLLTKEGDQAGREKAASAKEDFLTWNYNAGCRVVFYKFITRCHCSCWKGPPPIPPL